MTAKRLEFTPSVEAQCLGKERYINGQIAWASMTCRERQGKVGTVYRCPHCRSFHIGQPPGIRSRWSVK